MFIETNLIRFHINIFKYLYIHKIWISLPFKLNNLSDPDNLKCKYSDNFDPENSKCKLNNLPFKHFLLSEKSNIQNIELSYIWYLILYTPVKTHILHDF